MNGAALVLGIGTSCTH